MDDDQMRSSMGPEQGDEGDQGGVGGRQDAPPTPAEGGGYPDIRSISNFRAGHLQIDDLRRMGLPSRQLGLAEKLGPDVFVALWSYVGSDPEFLNRQGYAELKMRPFRSFLRYERNRYIKALCATGLQAEEIRRRVQHDLCEKLTIRHVYRVMAKK